MDHMNPSANRYAILATLENVNPNVLGNGYIKELTKAGALYLDFRDIYLRLGQKRSEQHIAQTLKDNHIEVLLYMAGPLDFHFSVPFFQKLQTHIFTAMTLGDTDHYFDLRDIYYAQCMDLVIVYDCLSKYRYHQYGIPAISFYSSYDRKKYFITDHLKKDIDISFVGNLSVKQGRKENIESIIKNGYEVKSFGPGSESGVISLEKMVEIFNRTKINLNFSGLSIRTGLRKEPKINLRLKQIKGRMAEIALCGGFVLSEYTPGIEDIFEIGKEIAVFNSQEEMLEKIRFYLKHDDEREKIALNGYRRAVKDYGIETAIPGLIRRIDELRKCKIDRANEIDLDPRFIKFYSTFRIGMIVEFIRAGKWNLIAEELWIICKCRKLDIFQMIKILMNLSPGLKNAVKKMMQGWFNLINKIVCQ